MRGTPPDPGLPGHDPDLRRENLETRHKVETRPSPGHHLITCNVSRESLGAEGTAGRWPAHPRSSWMSLSSILQCQSQGSLSRPGRHCHQSPGTQPCFSSTAELRGRHKNSHQVAQFNQRDRDETTHQDAACVGRSHPKDVSRPTAAEKEPDGPRAPSAELPGAPRLLSASRVPLRRFQEMLPVTKPSLKLARHASLAMSARSSRSQEALKIFLRSICSHAAQHRKAAGPRTPSPVAHRPAGCCLPLEEDLETMSCGICDD